jgi:hypothetical protein
LQRCVTHNEISIIVNPEQENANSSIRCNFDPVSNATDRSDLQDQKHDLHKTSTFPGIIMLRKPVQENAHSSIRCNFDPVSNVSD